ncbi:hypothetical protein DYB32_004028 [Aphanomyces invadans]|uniref:Uncharacterized protein n=1 Tax=Aphanomyces invadans TaxID=157072 RepID=A0A418AYR9_9STRA|nr:hypothetical protein DYB32_004028 [Aphanomyces invadans]
MSITQQLHAGIRYLDLRVQALPNGDIRLCHSLCSITLHDCLTQIRAYLDAYPNELILLDVNHIYVSDPSQYAQICQQVVLQLGRDCIATRAATPATSTLDSLNLHHVQVVLIYHHEPTAMLLNVWGANHIRSPWPNASSTSKVLRYIDASLVDRKLSVDQMHVTQLVATARPLDLVCHFSLLSFAKSLLAHALPWLKQLAQQRDARTKACNVVIVDDCGAHQYQLIQAILTLNKTKAGQNDAHVDLNR